MNIKEYAEKCRTFITMTDEGALRNYLNLGLIEEVGEVAGKLAKILRVKQSLDTFSDEERVAIAKELGDVCWFVCVSVEKPERVEERLTNFRPKYDVNLWTYTGLVARLSALSLDISLNMPITAVFILSTVEEIGRRIGYTLEEIMQQNIDKLTDRQARGVINGNGDNR